MKIALVGGSGFIGSWLVRCSNPEDSFIIVDQNPPPADIAQQVEYRPVDLLAAVNAPFSDLSNQLRGAEAVVLLAARRPPAKWYPEAPRDYLDNLRMAVNVMESCRQQGIDNVVFTSTISVYGHHNRVPYDETDPPQPDSYYGLSKVAAEQLALFLNREKNMAIKCLRLAHLFGVGEREDFMFMKFVRAAFHKKTLSIWGRGEGRREYIYVKDVADAIRTALHHRNLSGIYNIGTGQNVSHLELAELINSVFGNEGNLAFLQNKSEDKGVDGMLIRKAESILGWRPRWPLRQALEDIRKVLQEQSVRD